MTTDNWIALIGAVIAFMSLMVSIGFYVLSQLRADIQNLFKIKEGINQALHEFKRQVAIEYVTYDRMREHLDSSNRNADESIARIEQQLQSLAKLEFVIVHMAAKLNIDIPKVA